MVFVTAIKIMAKRESIAENLCNAKRKGIVTCILQVRSIAFVILNSYIVHASPKGLLNFSGQ